jgi:hypothetical protein
LQVKATTPPVNKPAGHPSQKNNAETLAAHRTTDAQTQALLRYYQKKLSLPLRAPYLVEDEALALARAAADGDDPDGALDELQRRHRLGDRHELALVVAVHKAERPRRRPPLMARSVQVRSVQAREGKREVRGEIRWKGDKEAAVAGRKARSARLLGRWAPSGP